MVQQTKGDRVVSIVIHILIAVIVVVMVLPFINILAVSFSSESAVISGKVLFWPVDFTVKTYERVFKGSQLMNAMGNTILLTVVGVAINMVMTILAAYPLSKKRLRGRTLLLGMITLTMIFGAGMIPNYLLIKALNLMNSYWALWLSGALSTYNMIVLKSFFQSLPESLEESAQIDGCSDFRILLRIVLPLSLPSLATIALFYAVGWWNSYFNVMLYMTSSSKMTLQVRLRDLVNLTDISGIMNAADQEAKRYRMAEQSIKAVSIVIATVPILLVYPFLQKYFVKGVMIGSIKG